jgi:hypothetical protein
MIKPVKRNLEIYKGADFLLQFRLKLEDAYINPNDGEVTFKASDKIDGTNVFSFSSTESPVTISIDDEDNYLITVQISATDTADITALELYYEVDFVDAGGVVSRWMLGSINIYGNAE